MKKKALIQTILLAVLSTGLCRAAEMPSDTMFANASQTNGMLRVSGEYPGWHLGYHLIDNLETKWLVQDTSAWIVYQFPGNDRWAVTNYSFVSGGDVPGRDPRSWVLEGSNDLVGEDFDNATWTQVDARTLDGTFPARTAEYSYSCEENTTSYNAYRLRILSNFGENMIQITEWRMKGFETTFAEPVSIDAEDDTIVVSSMLADPVDDDTEVFLIWGTQSGTYTSGTNIIDTGTGLATDTPFSIPFTETSSGTYHCRLIRVDNGVEGQGLGTTFHLGEVSVTCVSDANEELSQNGIFRFSRDVATALPLIVNYTVSGTAEAGADFSESLISGSVMIPGGAESVDVVVPPRYKIPTSKETDLELAIIAGNYFVSDPAPSALMNIKTRTDGLILRFYKSDYGDGYPLTVFNATPVATWFYQGSINYGEGDLDWHFAGVVGHEYYTLMWTGYVFLEGGQPYTFAAFADDLVYIMIDGDNDGFDDADVVVDRFHGGDPWGRYMFGTITVPTTGYYPIAISHMQGWGGRCCYVRWLKGETSHDQYGFDHTMNVVNTSYTTPGGFLMFNLDNVLPEESWFSATPEIEVAENGFSITSALGAVGDGAQVSVIWGAEEGVYSQTNTWSGTLAAEEPFSITCTNIADGTYNCALFVQDGEQPPVFAEIPDDIFYVGALTITADPLTINEADELPSMVTVARTGTNSLPLTVNYALSGTAVKGVDYVAEGLDGSAVIPAEETSVQITVTPKRNFGTLADTAVVVTQTDGAYFEPASPPSVTITIINEPIPFLGENMNIWLGPDVGDSDCWSLGRLPLEVDTIVLNDASVGRNLVWSDSLPQTVMSWVQDTNYTGTVEFWTTYDETFPVLEIVGDAVVDGGVWTHRSNNAAPGPVGVYYLNVSVGGDFTLGTNGVINVDARGFAQSNGPGSPVDRWWTGCAAYGGGGTHTSGGNLGDTNTPYRDYNFLTYGSILNPRDLGSANWHSPHSANHPGGGAVCILVDGTTLLDGSISATGQGWENSGGAASGGTINIHSGDFDSESTGRLHANAGNDNWCGAAGGGRIAVVASQGELPEGLYCEAVSPAINWWERRHHRGGAGTIYRETPTEKTIVIRNHYDYDYHARTALPAYLSPETTGVVSSDLIGDFKNIDVRILSGSAVIEHNIRLNDFSIENASSAVELNGKTLRVMSMTINGVKIPCGTYSGEELPNHIIDSSDDTTGELIIINPFTSIIVR